jgi:hypothetical protein
VKRGGGRKDGEGGKGWRRWDGMDQQTKRGRWACMKQSCQVLTALCLNLGKL